MRKPTLHWLLLDQDRNGLKKCVVRLGQRVLISERAYLDWVKSTREGK